MGLLEVLAHLASNLSPEAVKALRLADNKLGELADSNYELLPIELNELQPMELDINSLGFSKNDLSELLAVE